MSNMWSRLRGIGLWFTTGFDDFVVERTIGNLRRGDVSGALRTWTDLVVGFWGCAVVLVVVLALVTAATVAIVGWAS